MNLPVKQEKRDVVFRRIRGRIIPIRTGGKQSAIPKVGDSAKYAAAGVLAVAAGAEASSRIVKVAATVRQASKIKFRAANLVLGGANNAGQFMLDFGGDFAKARRLKTAGILMRRASTLIRSARRPILGGSILLGGFLLGRGIESGVESLRRKELKLPGEAAANIAGGAAALIGTALYYKRLGLPLRGALKYGSALRRGTIGNLPRIPINTKFGQLRFPF